MLEILKEIMPFTVLFEEKMFAILYISEEPLVELVQVGEEVSIFWVGGEVR